MKSTILIIFIFTLSTLLGCNPPRTRREDNNQLNNDFDPQKTALNPYSSRYQDTDPVTGSPSPGSSNEPIPSEFSHCNMSTYPGYHKIVGNYNICQSGRDDTKVGFKFEDAITTSQVCMFPLTQQSSGHTYIGGGQCVYYETAGQFQTFDFTKNRNGFSGEPLTAVIVIKHASYYYKSPFNGQHYATQAFVTCMEAKVATSTTAQDYFCRAYSQGSEPHYVACRNALASNPESFCQEFSRVGNEQGNFFIVTLSSSQ